MPTGDSYRRFGGTSDFILRGKQSRKCVTFLGLLDTPEDFSLRQHRSENLILATWAVISMART